MKINKIQENIITFSKYKNEHLQIKKENANAEEQNLNLPNNPKYYQALNYINFKGNFIALPHKKDGEIKGLKVRIPLNHDDKITLEFSKHDSIDVFLDEDGSLDTKALDFFAKHYASFYETKKEMYEKEKQSLLKILNDNSSKLRVLDPKRDIQAALLKNEKEENYITYGANLLDDLMDSETKKDFASMRLNRIEEEFKTYSITLAKELITVLKLSKQQDGTIDEKDLSKKISIGVMSTYYNGEVGKDCSDYIFNLSKNKNGKIDLDFCQTVLEVLINCSNGVLIKEEIDETVKLVKEYQLDEPCDYTDTIRDLIMQYQTGIISEF